MEYVVTIVLDHSGDPQEADRMLDAFLEHHADASPVVGEDPEAATIDVTFAVRADDGYQAFERGRALFAAATDRTDFARPVVGVTVEVAENPQLEAA